MKTLSIAISDKEYNKFGITGYNLQFSDFVDMISRELIKENINTSITVAEKYGLSSMSMEEITSEVQAVRKAVVC
jgi:hypothetical protein